MGILNGVRVFDVQAECIVKNHSNSLGVLLNGGYVCGGGKGERKIAGRTMALAGHFYPGW